MLVFRIILGQVVVRERRKLCTLGYDLAFASRMNCILVAFGLDNVDLWCSATLADVRTGVILTRACTRTGRP
jgi:hypothetical protein